MTENTRIKMESYKGILYCEAYMDDEFTLNDLESMILEIRKHYDSKSDVILKKVGTYSVTLDTQMKLSGNINEFRHFVYVVDSEVKRSSAEYAAATYMKPYNARVASSKEEAFNLLCEPNNNDA